MGSAPDKMLYRKLVEKARYDPDQLGYTMRGCKWMWRLTELGETYSLRRPVTPTISRTGATKKTVVDEQTAEELKKLYGVLLVGRRPMLCATIAREMGYDSYTVSGLLRRACRMGTVNRLECRGATYFELVYNQRD